MHSNPVPKLIESGLAAILALLLAACGCTTRPTQPPTGERFRVPEGAITILEDDAVPGARLGQNLLQAMGDRFAGELERDEAGRLVFRVLALSGGGSRGAYGAGVLVGWTEAGTRPEFDIVTGVSTGGLMATFAFLGPEYDDRLRRYTVIDNDDIFVTRNPLTGVFSDALRDTTPLRALIARQIDEEVLAAVAEQHAAGRRLFVGTTNLDAGSFTMWDLGQIASSDLQDKLQRYRDVVLASASFPMMFPPVYIPVEIDGKTHWQMHVDGSTRSNVFASTFMLDLDDALERSDYGVEDVHGQIWVIHNGQPPKHVNEPVSPSVISIAETAINNLLETSSRSGINELYAMAMVNGFSFAYASIPPEVALGPSPLEFDRGEMNQLFTLGSEGGRSGKAWQSQPPPAEPFELLQLLDPEVLRASSGRYPVLPHRPPRWMKARSTLSDNVSLTLCTGRRDGNYYRVGRVLQERLAPQGLAVELRQTEGSTENLQRIGDGSCDAAIAQHDAYFLHLFAGDSKRLRVLRPKYLFDEFVHVVCNRLSGVRRMSDFLEDPGRHRILVGESRSGSAVTWKVFRLLNDSYEAVPAEAQGGDAALSILANDESPACLLYVASLDTPFMHRIEGMAETLHLVEIDDPDVNNARIAGEKVYQFDRFPQGTYPALQANLERPDLPSVTVGSSLIIARDWARQYPQGYRLLLNVVAETRRDMVEGEMAFPRSGRQLE